MGLSQHEHNKKHLPQNEINFESLSLSEPEYKKVSQDKNKYRNIYPDKNKYKKFSHNEQKYKKFSHDEQKYKKFFHNEPKSAEASQGEIKLKGLSQSKRASQSLSMFTSLPPSTEGTGGALTGHSTAAHRSLRSLPPALEHEARKPLKTGLLSGLTVSTTKALSGVPYVMKRKTFRPGVARIFKHLPPECQQNYDDWCVCREYTLVGKNGGKTEA